MGFLFATFKKDLARWRQDYVNLSTSTGLKVLGDDGGPMGTLLIADLDDTLVSGVVAAAFGQDELSGLLGTKMVTVDEGTALIEAGDASGFLIIPAGFQDALINDTPVVLTLKTNPSQTILPGIIEDITGVLLDAGFYLQAAFGAEIAEITDTTELTEPTDLVVSGIAVKIQNKIAKLGPMLSPPLLDLTIVEPPPAEPQPDYALLFLPGVVLMALMFSAQGLSADFWAERESGTLRRLVSTPGLLSGFVLGKALAAGVIMGFIGGATLLLGFLYHDLVWNKLLPSVLWIAFAGIGLFAWFSALQMLLPTSKAANLFTTILVFPLLMMGGSFFPMEALPDWLAAIGRLSPNGFVVEKLSGELTAADSWTFAMSSWGIVLAMTLSGLLICSWRLGTGFARK